MNMAIPAPPRLTMAKSRLTRHADYQRVYKSARKQFSASMSWFCAAQASAPDIKPEIESGTPAASAPGRPLAPSRVGITAGKVLGKAHERNRIKRRMREAIRLHVHELAGGVDLVLHPKRSVMEMDFGKLEAEIARVFSLAGSQVGTQIRAAQAGSPQAGWNAGSTGKSGVRPSQAAKAGGRGGIALVPNLAGTPTGQAAGPAASRPSVFGRQSASRTLPDREP